MINSSGRTQWKLSVTFVVVAIACAMVGDIEVSTFDPWTELGRILIGLLTPDFNATENLIEALCYTLSFALLGFVLAQLLVFSSRCYSIIA
ncbi:hypothetical protein [Vibrio variabilis]|uniref:hypothetical protein n=1 Tax=Vibrio variabilis TaxID=990271 RepID=UPI001EFA1E62|nr:hypothetical protein [Vibrio variabilis]